MLHGRLVQGRILAGHDKDNLLSGLSGRVPDQPTKFGERGLERNQTQSHDLIPKTIQKAVKILGRTGYPVPVAHARVQTGLDRDHPPSRSTR